MGGCHAISLLAVELPHIFVVVPLGSLLLTCRSDFVVVLVLLFCCCCSVVVIVLLRVGVINY